jgi:hypothetical protein
MQNTEGIFYDLKDTLQPLEKEKTHRKVQMKLIEMFIYYILYLRTIKA